ICPVPPYPCRILLLGSPSPPVWSSPLVSRLTWSHSSWFPPKFKVWSPEVRVDPSTWQVPGLFVAGLYTHRNAEFHSQREFVGLQAWVQFANRHECAARNKTPFLVKERERLRTEATRPMSALGH